MKAKPGDIVSSQFTVNCWYDKYQILGKIVDIDTRGVALISVLPVVSTERDTMYLHVSHLRVVDEDQALLELLGCNLQK
jgi:hypothetical protein